MGRAHFHGEKRVSREAFQVGVFACFDFREKDCVGLDMAGNGEFFVRAVKGRAAEFA